MSRIIAYDPTIEEHPEYTEDRPDDVSEGDAINVLGYTGIQMIDHDEGTAMKFLSDDYEEPAIAARYVTEVDGFKLRVKPHPSASMGEWIPETRVHSRCYRKQAKWERRSRNRRRRTRRIQRRKDETDMDTLLNDIVIPHARKKVSEVWSGGTVDLDATHFFWNTRLRSSAGMAYQDRAVPKKIDARYAIGLAPAYYHRHGVDELLKVVRHELIHQWQFQHPDGGRGGHGPKFKQWIDDLDTHRHCKHWSK